jgi:chromosome segregation ATPase
MCRTGRTAALVAAVSALVALAGCSSGNTAASGSPTVSASPVTQWAGSVCSSVQNLQQSLKDLTSSITVNAKSSQSSLTQAKQQVLKKVGEVEAAATRLVATLQNPPASSDQQVKAAQQQLKAASDRSRQALQQLKSVTTALQADSTAAGFARDAVAAGAAAVSAASDIGSLLTSLKQYASSMDSSLRNAFGDAPSCQALSSGE